MEAEGRDAQSSGGRRGSKSLWRGREQFRRGCEDPRGG